MINPHLRANYQDEAETAWLYRSLAEHAPEPPIADVLRQMAEMEQRHADRWARERRQAGETLPPFQPGMRVRVLAWLGRHFGIAAVLPSVMASEERATLGYVSQPDAPAARLPQTERGHARIFRAMQGVSGTINGPMLAQQALDTLAREELGLDPQELGGSAWVAAGTSFLLFSLGAMVPVIPFIFGTSPLIIVLSLLASVVGLVIIGASISVTTGTSLWRTCTRQVGLGITAAVVTFGLGRLIGSRLA